MKQTGTFRLEEAVRRMSATPSCRMGIVDRGLIALGLMLINMEELKDNATYETP